MYDLIIKNANIVDGTGSPAFSADIAIKDGKIALVGFAGKNAAQIIDAKGLTAAPGFIDSHSHSDSALFTFPDLIEKIEQGITTSIAGQCGSSPAPVAQESVNIESNKYGRMSEFLHAAAQNTYGSNTACFVGHRALRKTVMGNEMRDATAAEMEQMKALLRDGLEHGALGLSFGLIYIPGCFAKTPELIELAKVVGEYHGVVAAHIRSEGQKLVSAVEEFIEIIRQSGTRGVLSHHKAAGGKENWGKVSHTLRLIDEANANGIEIYLDVYPYSACSTKLAATLIPPSSKGIVEQLTDLESRAQIKQ